MIFRSKHYENEDNIFLRKEKRQKIKNRKTKKKLAKYGWMGWFVSPHSLKLIVLNVIMLPFTMPNILQPISIPKAVFGGRYTCNLNFHTWYEVGTYTRDKNYVISHQSCCGSFK